jgi:hypothetical protein
MLRAPLTTVVLVLLVLARGAPADDTFPEAWEASYEESFVFEHGQAPVVLSWSDGLHARRFYLRLDANEPFDARLVRDQDGVILYDGRRANRHHVMIPWGYDETAHLTIDPYDADRVMIVLEVAVDPRETGLAVYSFQVNRFLRFHESQDTRRGKEALALALSEDPTDEMAGRLWAAVWKAEGIDAPRPDASSGRSEPEAWLNIAENLQLDRMGYEADTIFTEHGFNAALSYLDDEDVAAPFRTRHGRRGFKMLLASIATRDDQNIRAVEALEEAMDLSEGFPEREEVYHLLFEAYRRQGNEGRAHDIQQRAAKEAPDAAARQQVTSWPSG